MAAQLLLQHVKTPSGVCADILVDAGRIVRIAPDLPPSSRTPAWMPKGTWRRPVRQRPYPSGTDICGRTVGRLRLCGYGPGACEGGSRIPRQPRPHEQPEELLRAVPGSDPARYDPCAGATSTWACSGLRSLKTRPAPGKPSGTCWTSSMSPCPQTAS